MVVIKDFGMPSCCENCNINKFDYLGSQGTAHWNCAITENECEDYENKRNSDCPLVEIEERKEGKWIYHEKSISTAFKELRECSCCHCYFRWEMPRNSYCPNCGAEMRGVENG